MRPSDVQTPHTQYPWIDALRQTLQTQAALTSALPSALLCALLCALTGAALLAMTPLGQPLEQAILSRGLNLRPAPPPNPTVSVVVLRGQAPQHGGVSVRLALTELLELLASTPHQAPGAVLVDVLLSEQESLQPFQSSLGQRIQAASAQLGRVIHTVSTHTSAHSQHTRAPDVAPLKSHLLVDAPHLPLGPVAPFWQLASPQLAPELYQVSAAVGNIGFSSPPDARGLLLELPMLSRVLLPARIQPSATSAVLELPETALLPSLSLAGAALMRCVPPQTQPAPGWLQTCLQPTPNGLNMNGSPVPLDPQGQLPLSYRRTFQLAPEGDAPLPLRGYEVVAFRDSSQGPPSLVLPDGAWLSPAALKNRALLVIDAHERQSVMTPLGAAFPPATAHAQALAALLAQDWLRPVPLFWQLLLTASSLWWTLRMRIRGWGVQTSLTLLNTLFSLYEKGRGKYTEPLSPSTQHPHEQNTAQKPPPRPLHQSLLLLTRSLLRLLLLLFLELLWTPELLLVLGWGVLSISLLVFSGWWLPVVPSIGALLAAGVGWRLASGWQLEQEQRREQETRLALEREVLPVANNAQALHELRSYEALEQVLPPHELEALDALLETAIPLLGAQHARATPTYSPDLSQQVRETQERLRVALERMQQQQAQAQAAQRQVERHLEQVNTRESVFSRIGRLLPSVEPLPSAERLPSAETRADASHSEPSAERRSQLPTSSQTASREEPSSPSERLPPVRHAAALLTPPEVPAEQVQLAERYGIYTRHPGLLAFVWDAVHRLSGHRKTPVLLLGESGTGKGLLAKLLHDAAQAQEAAQTQARGGSSIGLSHTRSASSASPRRAERQASAPLPAFRAVNCAQLVPELMLATLNGYQKGAFTGAQVDTPSCFETAPLGTTFLDEVGELHASAQAALLKIIEEREVIRLGENRPRPLDTRIVLATHQDLETQVQKGVFRHDLWHRINIITYQVPALHERLYDIPLIVQAFFKEHEPNTPLTLSPEALERLQHHPWPGNVRELRNVLTRLTIFAPNPLIERSAVEEALIFNARWLAPQLPFSSERRLQPPPEPPSPLLGWEERLGALANTWLENLRRHHFELLPYAEEQQIQRQRADAQLRVLLALSLEASQLRLDVASELLAGPLAQEKVERLHERLRERLQLYLRRLTERYGPSSDRAHCSDEELTRIFSKDYGTFVWAPVKVISLLRQQPALRAAS